VLVEAAKSQTGQSLIVGTLFSNVHQWDICSQPVAIQQSLSSLFAPPLSQIIGFRPLPSVQVNKWDQVELASW